MSYFVYVLWSARGRLPAFRAALIAATVIASSLTLGTSAAFADPSADDWARLRMCESSGNYAINTGNGYYGAYQFTIGTWEWMGGTGLPSDASPAEQDYRALKLYRINGWGPWPACTKKLGLVNDADAKSKVIPPDPGFAAPSTAAPAPTTKPKPAKKPKPTTTAPATTSSAVPTTTTPPPSATSTPAKKKKKAASSPKATPPPATTGSPAPTTTPPPASSPTTSATQAAPAAAKKKKRRSATDSAPTADTPEVDTAPPAEAPDVPEWSGQQYFPGDYSEDLKIWQHQAAALGYDVVPTGYFGPKTEQAAQDLQRRGGLTPIGYIGPQTWASAWSTDPNPGSAAGQIATPGR